MKPTNARDIVLCLALTAVGAQPCWAVIVLEKGKTEPTRGYLLSQDDSRLVIKEVLPNGETRERTLPRANIEEIIRAVSDERLSALSPDKPQAYRDYAEELAAKREDPDAGPAALRLYLIAAHLDPDKLGRSCLLGMANLARSPEEEKKFRAMAFLLDSDHDRSVLRPPARSEGDISRWSDEERGQLDVLLRALREGRFDDARAIARQPTTAAFLPKISKYFSVEDFSTLRRGDRAPARLLASVLTLSLMLAGEAPAGPEEGSAGGSRHGWSQLSNADASQPIPSLTLATITEFDPTQCHYRNGKWER